MIVEITTNDPDMVDVAEIHEALENFGYYVGSITVYNEAGEPAKEVAY